MRGAYRALAFLVCALVAVQAASMAWATAGLVKFLQGGGVIDFSSNEMPPVPEFLGILVHGMNGMFVIPVVALALLVVAFLSKIPGTVVPAAIVLGLVVLQVTLGFMGHELTFAALLHGLNALLLFTAALVAGLRVGQRRPAGDQQSAQPMTSGRS